MRCARGADCLWPDVVDGLLVGGLIDGEMKWDLDHTDDRRGYLGPSHEKCNRSAGARKRNAKTRRSRQW